MSHKDILRERIQQQTSEFLARGGKIRRVASGVSGQDGQHWKPNAPSFSGQPNNRTEVPEVVAAIEARKAAMRRRKPAPRRNRVARPRRKLVYDDFGEPLRWEWVNE